MSADLAAGRYNEAEACARQLAGADSLHEAQSTGVREALAEALLANGRGFTHEALAAAREALEAQRALVPHDHDALARAAVLLGQVHRERGEAEAARALFDEALALRRAAGERSERAEALAEGADARRRLGLYPEALALSEEAIALAAPARDLAYAQALAVQAEVCLAMGALTQARANLDEALVVRGHLAPDHPETARAWGRLGNLLNADAQPDEALAAYRRALELLEARLGSWHPRLVWPLGRVAGHVTPHDLAEGLRLHQRAVRMAEDTLGPDHPETGGRLNDLANATLASGDAVGARALYERALALAPSEPEPQRSRRIATVHYNLSEVDAVSGDLDGAVAEAREAVRLWRLAEGPEHRFVAIGLEGLADALERRGDSGEALQVFDEALSLRRRVLGDAHPHTAAAAARLGLARLARGEIGKARAAARLAEGALERLRATAPVAAVRVLLLQARLAQTERAPSTASARLALAADGLEREYVRRTVRHLAENDALAALPARRAGLDLAATVATHHRDAQLARDVHDHVVRSRALVLDELAAREAGDGAHARPEIEIPRRRLSLASRRLATLLYRSGAGQPEEAARVLAEARRERDQAERELALASSAFARQLEREDVGAERVMQALPNGSALVSFLRHDVAASPPGVTAREPHARYVAFVRQSGQQTPRLVALGDAAQIEAAVERWHREAGNVRGASSAAALERYLAAARDLAGRVWAPVERQLGRSTRVFIVPDGALHLVSFATLPERGGYVLESPRQLHYLAAERDAVAPPAGAPGVGLLAAGAAAHDLPLAEVTRVARSRLSAGPRLADGISPAAASVHPVRTGRRLRGRRSDCDQPSRSTYENLPATRAEIDDVATAWRRFTGTEALSLLDAEASGELVTALAPGQRVLHFAVHGFVFEDCRADVGRPRGLENPLLRSGLVFAGANRRSETSSTDDDGMLTSDEIAHLDLGPVEWVVLSACDTGRGPVHGSEGVLGLRRAFRRAGARTIIMSLWQVDDDAAREWMRGLYEARLRDRLDTAAAMRSASLGRLRAQRRVGGSTHPALWGPFVAVGDWR